MIALFFFIISIFLLLNHVLKMALSRYDKRSLKILHPDDQENTKIESSNKLFLVSLSTDPESLINIRP